MKTEVIEPIGAGNFRVLMRKVILGNGHVFFLARLGKFSLRYAVSCLKYENAICGVENIDMLVARKLTELLIKAAKFEVFV